HTSAQDLHNVVFRKFMTLGHPYLHKHPVGELVSLVANDVSYFRMALGPGVILLLDAATLLLILPPLMISISPEWTWKTLILLPVVPFLMVKLTQLVDR